MLDILLIHPPSNYDFRERRVHYGPISDVIPSYPVFDMYPIGFISIVSHLVRQGYRVGVLNLAALMLLKRDLDVESLLRKSRARIFAIDIHWLVSAQGAMEVARILRREHPGVPILVGGLSASYYYREIMEEHPEIDHVLRGDTTEESLLQLVDHVAEDHGDPARIPNLVWRDRNRIRINESRPAPADLDGLGIDYGTIIRRAVISGNPLSFLPYADFLKAPAAGVILYKGCTLNCIGCGGSRYAYAHSYGRSALGVKSPETIWAEISSILEYLRIPVFLVGDPQGLGRRWLSRFVEASPRSASDASMYFEFFTPPPHDFLNELLRLKVARISFQISPESHDETIRRTYGRPYSNEALERFVDIVDRSRVQKLDVYMMTGLPRQDVRSARESASYADRLMSRSAKVDVLISPLAPFVDPGSIGFERAESMGYRLFARTFEEHRLLMDRARTWKEMLNYETEWMSRDEIVKSTYESSRVLLQAKARHGRISEPQLQETLERIRRAEVGVQSGPWASKWEIVPSRTLYPTSAFITSLRPRSLLAPIQALTEAVARLPRRSRGDVEEGTARFTHAKQTL